MNLAATSFVNLHRPSTCEKRVFLAARLPVEGEPTELELALREMGERHEKEHLATFPESRNLSEGSLADRAQRTREAVSRRTAVIYQGVLRAALPGSRDVVTGIPDFMILDGDSYRIRDCKLARSIRTHPEIAQQLQTCGWLFESAFGKPPAGLEVYLGDRTLDSVPYAGAGPAVSALGRIRELSLLSDEPWEPLGWSKCEACCFQDACWKKAGQEHDVSLVYGVDQATARALRNQGVGTWDQLLEGMDADSLGALVRPRGKGRQRVGAAARRILLQARALATGKVIRLGPPRLPEGPLVMLDLEGMPPWEEEPDRVYLWGTRVYEDGRPGGPYRAALAGFGPDGERAGWKEFLRNAEDIFEKHGNAPFVHWAAYETTRISACIRRYGDPQGTGARVLGGCFDLLKCVRDAFALPLPGYGLKMVERFCGYTRAMEEYGGDWSIGRYLRACQSTDERERSSIMVEIARYNEEDLDAMAAVLSWVRADSGANSI